MDAIDLIQELNSNRRFHHNKNIVNQPYNVMSGRITGFTHYMILSLICSTSNKLLNFQIWDLLLNGDFSGVPSYYTNVTGCTDYYNYMRCKVGPSLSC